MASVRECECGVDSDQHTADQLHMPMPGQLLLPAGFRRTRPGEMDFASVHTILYRLLASLSPSQVSMI